MPMYLNTNEVHKKYKIIIEVKIKNLSIYFQVLATIRKKHANGVPISGLSDSSGKYLKWIQVNLQFLAKCVCPCQ
jgi:hypothetical protein